MSDPIPESWFTPPNPSHACCWCGVRIWLDNDTCRNCRSVGEFDGRGYSDADGLTGGAWVTGPRGIKHWEPGADVA